MTLTIITVNFNSTRETIRLLESLRAQQTQEFDIIVVDNDSEPEEREQLGMYAASYIGALDVIYSSRNLGFSGGNNLGIRKALAQGAEWILLINNDATVSPQFISDVRAQLPNTPSLVGVPIHEGERIAYAGHVAWCAPTLPHVYQITHDPTTTYIIGAGLFIHRAVIERIGFLDESYFLYFEDADFSLRARRAGIPIQHLLSPVISHQVSTSTKTLGSPLLLRYHIRNSIRFNRAHAPIHWRLALPFVLIWTALKQIVKLALGRSTAQSWALLAGIRDGLLGRSGRIRTLPTIAVECESLEGASWGVARQIRGFLTAFTQLPEVRNRYEIIAYFKSYIPDESWLQHTNVHPIVIRPFRWLPDSFSLYFYIFFPIRAWIDRPAVTFISNYMLPIIFFGRTIVMLTEDVWYEMRGKDLPLKYRVAYRIFSAWAARRATRIMAITHASARRVADLFGIASPRLVVNELAVEPARTVSPRAGSYVLYVGQGLPRRHLRETIQAFALIAPQHPHLTLYAIGPDKYRPPCIKNLVDEVNAILHRTAVIWAERVTDDELASAYAGARLLIYVSDMEAFGLPPLEALSYRVPSVVMDAPVHRELLGEHAFYTASAVPSDLARVIEQGLTDETHRAKIVHAAKTIVSRYTWNEHALRMLRIVEDILHP
jgi:GT2 family glycosyltransferase